MAKLRVTLEIDLTPWSAEEMAQEARQCGYDLDEGFDGEADIPSASEMSELIAGALSFEDVTQEMFAGSNIYVHLGDIRVAGADYPEIPA